MNWGNVHMQHRYAAHDRWPSFIPCASAHGYNRISATRFFDPTTFAGKPLNRCAGRVFLVKLKKNVKILHDN